MRVCSSLSKVPGSLGRGIESVIEVKIQETTELFGLCLENLTYILTRFST